VGDVHPHVIGMFNQVLFIFLLVYSLLRFRDLDIRGRSLLVLVCGLSLGSMPPINTWDVIVYAPITLLIGLMIWHEAREPTPGAGLCGTLASSIRRAGEAARSCLSLHRSHCRVGAKRLLAMVPASPWSFFLLVPVTAVLCYLPFYIQMNSQGIMGVGFVHHPTAPPISSSCTGSSSS